MIKDDKLRFLFISADKYPPFRVDIDVLFGDLLSGKGHQIDWILQSEKDNPKNRKSEWKGNTVWVLRTDNRKSTISRIKKYVYRTIYTLFILKRLSNAPYDFIQVKDRFFSAIAAAFFAKKRGYKFFYWLSYPFPEANIYRYENIKDKFAYVHLARGLVFSFLLYKMILPRADHIFVQSVQMSKDLAEKGVPKSKMTVVPMGIKMDDIEIKNKMPKTIEKHKPSLLYLGTMLRIRQLDFVLRVFKGVLEKCPDCMLYMVGGSENPQDLDFLKKEAENLGISEQTVFTGNLERGKALSYIEKSDVCISPFLPIPILNSTSPTKILEYLLFEKPVVANDHPEQKEIISNSGAGYCVPYNEKKFVGAIVRMLSNMNESIEMGKKGRKYVIENRSYDIIAKRVEQSYFKAL